MCQPNSHGEKRINQTLMVRRVQQASMGQQNSHGEKSPTGIYGSTELTWWEGSNRHLWVNQTLMVNSVQQASMGQTLKVRRVKQAPMGQPNSHGGKGPTGIYGSTELSW